MKNILMNAEMAKAILDGRKVQTRRVLKIPFEADSINVISIGYGGIFDVEFENFDTEEFKIIKPQYQIGDILWVREPAKIIEYSPVGNYGGSWNDCDSVRYEYLADGETRTLLEIPERFKNIPKWIKKCQGVPNGCLKEMARIFLKIADVRVERLFDITQKDIYNEGIEPKTYTTDHVDEYTYRADLKDYAYQEFMRVWNSVAKDGFKWNDNPYVFVYEFERVEKEHSVRFG
jgi:hypothetical protein